MVEPTDLSRLITWLRDKDRKPPELAFTSGELREAADIQRKHLIRKFGISVPQASADLQQFQKDHPQAIRYDASKKRYINTLFE